MSEPVGAGIITPGLSPPANIPAPTNSSPYLEQPHSFTYAIDPIALMIDECMRISSAMRKQSRLGSLAGAAIFGGPEFYGEDEPLVAGLHSGNISGYNGHSGASQRLNATGRGAGATHTGPAHPLHASFVQLRAMLAETSDIKQVDALTLLQPFLVAIEARSASAAVTALALGAVRKLLRYEILSFSSKNSHAALIQLTTSLTRCRFEASDQGKDDAVLLQVLRLLETLLSGPLAALLPNSAVADALHTCVSLACNKRRSEVLRRAAEIAVSSMATRLFARVGDLVPGPAVLPEIVPNIPAEVTVSEGVSEIVSEATPETSASGSEPATPTVDLAPLSPRQGGAVPEKHDQFDVTCIHEFLRLLIAMCAPENQYQHTESARVLALSLLTTSVEVAGLELPKHPVLMALFADPVSKSVSQIIASTDSAPLLSEALRLFCTMVAVLGSSLKSQMELTFNLIFKSLLPNKAAMDTKIKGSTAISLRSPASKELIVESLSFLWTRSPQFFARLFVEYDCDFENSDLANTFVDFLCELALPESAITTTDNVPPICLEGILSFVSGINSRAKASLAHKEKRAEPHRLIADKVQKNSFIKCMEIFNENPKKGIAALSDKQFIKDTANAQELAQFFFQKSTRLNKKVLGEYLAKPANSEVLKEFMLLFDFGGLRVDEGLRIMLKSFRLPGESQQIERIVELFAEAFVGSQTAENNVAPEDHPDREPVLPDRDAVFILSYSIIMLNTDLHNPQVKKSMDLEAYRRNLKGVYNGKDFPEWYMASIYSSIKDKEIIMPEEHHGTDKWFDDVWHNLISSQSNWARDHGNSVDDFDAATLCDFDRLLFESVVESVVETLIKVFREATDDSIITKLMSSIDKCANVCAIYNLAPAVSHMIDQLTKLTTLADNQALQVPEEDNLRLEIPITQLNIEKREDPITVSELSVYFGKDFKAQLSTVVLFRLIKKPECQVSDSWSTVVRLILNLFENCLIEPNIFGEFQRKLKLTSLPKVKPSFVIEKMKPLKESGLLSTFSSFLKGYSDEPPEPSDQEIESTLSTIDCVKSLNISGIFDVVSKKDHEQMKSFILLLSSSVPEFNTETSRFYEAEVLFVCEIMVCFTLRVEDDHVTNSITSRIGEVLDSAHLSSKGYTRLSTYLLLLVRQSTVDNQKEVIKAISHILSFEPQDLAQYGSSLVQPLFSLVDNDSAVKDLFTHESFWNILRALASVKAFPEEILVYAETVVHDPSKEISSENYLPFLSVLDEISSLGAVGAQAEQSETVDISEKQALENKELVAIAKRSVSLTGELGTAKHKSSYPLIQALAHQCFNPCREIRGHAVRALQNTISSGELSDTYTAEGLFQYGLFPLLVELQKEETLETDVAGFWETHSQVLSLVGKTFLRFNSELPAEVAEKMWLRLVDDFIGINQLAPQVREPSLEVMKNMILVLQHEFLTAEKKTLWEQTWTSLDKLFPELQAEITSK